MNKPLPIKIEPCPIIDTSIEFRFKSNIEKNAVLGIIYNSIKEDYSGNIEKLPIIQLPEQIRDNDPAFMYKPLYRIVSEPFVILIGNAMVCIGSKIPYVGWDMFSKHIISILKKILNTGIISSISRIGHRYINFFEGKDISKCFNITFSMANEITPQTISIRTEIKDGDFVNLLQVLSNAKINTNNSHKELIGSIIDIDTSCEYKDNYFMSHMEDVINNVHNCEKKLFFSLLKEDFIATLNPKYQ